MSSVSSSVSPGDIEARLAQHAQAIEALLAGLLADAARPGEIVDQSGAVLGRHDGIFHFTVGQRKGLGLSGKEEPLFVLKLDAARARVVVGPKREAARGRGGAGGKVRCTA